MKTDQDVVRAAAILHDVLTERNRQDEQWGDQNHHPAYWLAILGKQVGQFGNEVLNREWWNDREAATLKMRNEAIQIAAVAVAIVECIDRGEMPVGLTTAKPSDPRQLARVLNRGDESLQYDRDDEATPLICACGDPKSTHTVFLHDAQDTHPIGEPGSEPCS